MPLGGVRLTLFADHGDGSFDPAVDQEVDSTVSDGDRAFSFGGIGPGDHFVAADLGDGLLGTLTGIRSANPVGPVAAGATDVLFVADPIDDTLPATGGGTTALLWWGLGLLVAGGVLAASRRRPGRLAPA